MRVPVLLVAATFLAISSWKTDQIRIAEANSAFFGGNAVHIHRAPVWLPLALGLCSMVLSGVAWWITKRRVLVFCFAALLAPIAFQLYLLILIVFFILGIYQGPMP